MVAADGGFNLSAFDYKNPEYLTIFKTRADRLRRLKNAQAQAIQDRVPKEQQPLTLLKRYYRDNIAQFIIDWGCAFDPRNPERGLPSALPFLLFERQIEFVDWVIAHWKGQHGGVCAKSRELGVSWLTVCIGVTMCLFYDGLSIGYGSRKEEYVDKIGEPKSLFWKARFFLEALPVEFRGGWVKGRDDPHMRMIFPETGSSMGGEGGANIGRGDRRSIYFVDESAHLERPQLVEAALSMTTNCRIDVSSANGRANPFADKYFSYPEEHVFRFHWSEDPRKDRVWYETKCAELNNPVVVAQELDIDFSASMEGVLIPSTWVQAAIDAHIRLGFPATGDRLGGLDVADEGKDTCAYCGAHGAVIEHVEEWSGKGSDTFATAERAFSISDGLGYKEFRYDADGIGAYVRGDARVINARRLQNGQKMITVTEYRASGAVTNPTREDVTGRKNEDYFKNFNSQSWWALRTRFMNTYRAVVDKVQPVPGPEHLISIDSSKIDKRTLQKLCVELSQPTYGLDNNGKIIIEKQPDGASSPNLADAVKIRFAPLKRGLGWMENLTTEQVMRIGG